MHHRYRLVFVFVALALLAAIPSTAFASKKIWKARISSDAELHTVVGADTTGSLVFTTDPGSNPRVAMTVRGLSGTPTAAHLHGPATETENAPVLIPLCGTADSVAPTCDLDASGNLVLEGNLRTFGYYGLTTAQFSQWLDNGLIYVNVHTALNPAGEARGQLYPR